MNALLLVLLAAQAPPPTASPLVQMRDLSPREHRVAGFVLAATQDVRVEAVGAEPRPGRRTDRDDEAWWRENEERATWPAAAWILDTRSREVVWDLRGAESARDANGLRRFSGTLRLPAGTYEAHYGSFPATWSDREERGVSLRELAQRARRARDGGAYVDDGAYRSFALSVTGAGRAATAAELEAARRTFARTAIVSLAPGPGATVRSGFQLARAAEIEVYAIGELTKEGAFDHAWIINADTRERVWRMEYAATEPAGGARKNRMVREALRLPAGRYVAYFASDESHGPDGWNAVPAFDPAFWGLTLRVADAAARTAIRPFEFEPVPAGHTLVTLTGIGDGEARSAGFTLRRAMDVRIYAIGEGVNDDMADYAWIVDATRHRRVWTMRRSDTEPAGGAQKNRLFDGTLRLEPGAYLVYYTSDGSHSAGRWNDAPPAEPRYWGVSVFPASGRLDSSAVAPFERAPAGAVVAELVRMGNDERARAPFTLDRDAAVRVYALGEGDGEMYDYGWIEEEPSGRVVWEMTYRTSDPAGGTRKNRAFDGVIQLRAGRYLLRYRSDGSHAYGDWNSAPPDDPEAWGITVFRTGDR